MATILAMVCNEVQTNWDVILLGVHKLTTSAYSPSGNGGRRRTCLPHHGKITSHRFATNTMTGMHTFSASNTPAITPLARRQASLPMKYTSDAYCAPPSSSLIAPTVEPIRALTTTISPIANLSENDNNAPTRLCMNSTPLQSLV